jgi:hypothetical protein
MLAYIKHWKVTLIMNPKILDPFCVIKYLRLLLYVDVTEILPRYVGK